MIAVARFVLVAGVILTATVAFAEDTASVPSDLVPDGYRVTERHSFNLGAQSGSYTDWHRYDLASFDGFATVIEVPQIYGKPKDKWAAVVKIQFFVHGQMEKPSFALLFMADRKTERIHALVERGDDISRFDVTFGLRERVQVVVTPQSAEKLEVRIGDTKIEMPAPIQIEGIALIGSGLDVTFEPFTMLGKKSADR